MKKKIKVFEVGNYPQGEFSIQAVKDIFGNIKGPVSGIFSHTTKWLTENKEPVKVGTFDNFEISGNNVYAELEFNEKGINYYNDGILKGVSVEIDGTLNKVNKIAVLPIGITPAIIGAEFQVINEGINLLEFEEVNKLKLTELIAGLEGLSAIDRITLAIATLKELDVTQCDVSPILTRAWELDDQQWYIKNLITNGYVVEKTTEFNKEKLAIIAKPLGFNLVEFENKIKTEDEIRKEITLEFENKSKLEELKKNINKKIFPILQPFVEFALEKSILDNRIIEFSENEKTTTFEKFTKIINEMPESKIFKEHYKEFSGTDKNEDDKKNTGDRIGGYYG
ncbi:MAG: hypothetical protein ACRC6K_00125 [Fusobacteriaceae bacterium]